MNEIGPAQNSSRSPAAGRGRNPGTTGPPGSRCSGSAGCTCLSHRRSSVEPACTGGSMCWECHPPPASWRAVKWQQPLGGRIPAWYFLRASNPFCPKTPSCSEHAYLAPVVSMAKRKQKSASVLFGTLCGCTHLVLFPSIGARERWQRATRWATGAPPPTEAIRMKAISRNHWPNA